MSDKSIGLLENILAKIQSNNAKLNEIKLILIEP